MRISGNVLGAITGALEICWPISREPAFEPCIGHESEITDVKTDKPKRVMVIGAGPAGLAAAISAAKAGHSVKVYEKNRLGRRTVQIRLCSCRKRRKLPVYSLGR